MLRNLTISILATVLLLSTKFQTEASVSFTSSYILDYYDIQPNNLSASYNMSCKAACRVYVTVTSISQYEDNIVFYKDDNTILTSLGQLARANADKAGLKTPLVIPAQRLRVVNSNKAVDPARPYYMLFITNDASNSDTPVYEATSGSYSTSTSGITLMSALSFFTLSKFDINTAPTLNVYPGGYDVNDHGLFISANGSDAASKVFFPSFSPIVSVFASGRSASEQLTFTVDTTQTATWTIAKGGSFSFSSPGYMGLGSHALNSPVGSGLEYSFNFDGSATVKYQINYDIQSKAELDVYFVRQTDKGSPMPFVGTGGRGNGEVSPVDGVKCAFIDNSAYYSGFVISFTTSGSAHFGSWTAFASLLAAIAFLFQQS